MVTLLTVLTMVMVTMLTMALANAEPPQQSAVVRPARRGVRVRVTR